MRTGQTFDFVLVENIVELAAGSAITVGDKNMFVFLTVLFDLRSDSLRDLAWLIVKVGRQTLNADVRPLIKPNQVYQLVRKCPAGNNEYLCRHHNNIASSQCILSCSH